MSPWDHNLFKMDNLSVDIDDNNNKDVVAFYKI
jgi:hypothetical protein